MRGQTITVTSTAARIFDGTQNSGPPYAASAIIKNPTGGNNVFLGGSNVDNGANGYLLAGGDVISADVVGDGDSIWAVAAVSQAIYILRRGAP